MSTKCKIAILEIEFLRRKALVEFCYEFSKESIAFLWFTLYTKAKTIFTFNDCQGLSSYKILESSFLN